MYSVYIIKSLALGQFYVGLTKNLRQRIIGHRHAHACWFVDGHKVAIISQHRTVLAALRAEARAIVKYNTLSPNGLNKASAGAVGHFASLLTPAQREELKALRTQDAKDVIALSKMAKRPRAGLGKKTQTSRRYQAWKRQDSGLPPLPGTEYLLEGPRRPPQHKHNAKTRKQMTASRKRWLSKHQTDEKVQNYLKNWKGKIRNKQDKASKSAASVRRFIVAGTKLTWPQICRAIKRAKTREAQGDAAIPGTEWYTEITKKPQIYCPRWRSEEREYRAWAVDYVHQWRRQYAIANGWAAS